ncbi:hypothetical protein HDV03_004765 [Kappamyces sp. JEL0829]|nr:hypothetical protein HDV03_004755 [Kappamyces sp. JEL0829]KAJ3306635.1 hypothetical protein HDV03_004765 [Kappamyces sp. JEL0829]
MLSTSPTPDQQSLVSVFSVCMENFKKEEKAIEETLSLLLQCSSTITSAGIFSSNETLADVSTASLLFILADFYIGATLLRIPVDMRQAACPTAAVLTDRVKPERREFLLGQALKYFELYLGLVDMYELMGEQDKKWLDRVKNGIKPKGDAIRMEKIAQFKRERDSKSKLAELDELIGASPGEDSEELQRELTLAYVELAIQQTISYIKDIKEELEMIEFGKQAKLSLMSKGLASASLDTNRDDKVDESIRKTTSYSGPLLSKEGKPLRPFMITTEHNKRMEIQNGVFRYGHNLPTMTIEEYLDREMERGNVLSGGTEPPKKQDPDDQDHEALDAATVKARDWDDFKDFNPAGWGNRHRKG